MERVPNPLVIAIRPTVRSLSPDIIYLIHTADLAAELYPDFDYLANKIRDNVYWFENDKELDSIIKENLSPLRNPEIIVNLDELSPDGEVYCALDGEKAYLLNKGQAFHADLSILSRLHRRKINIEYLAEGTPISFRNIKVVLKELGMLDEIYTEELYFKYLSKIGMPHVLPYIYEHLWQHRPKIIYDLDEPYDNPYENILFVEDYLTRQPIYNLDISKFEEYELKHGKLPARYTYSGFNTTTGRIYCTSEEWASLPNLPKSKRDVLVASPGYYLIEFDFKSFEFDILCQILGIEVPEDPHTAIYERLVGVHDVPNARDIGKQINYSFIYGINENRLVDLVLNAVPDLTRDFRDTFIQRLHEEEIIGPLREFESNLRSTASNGVIQNYFCRNIYYKKEHAILSNYISSTATDLLFVKFRQVVDHIGYNGSILLENHDSILLHLKEEYIESQSFDELIELMRSPVSGIKGRIDIDYGRNWRDMK